MKTIRSPRRPVGFTVLALAAALAAAGCGDDKDAGTGASTASTPVAADVQVTPAALRKTLAAAPEPERAPAAPNLLGGGGEITRVLDRLDRDLTLFFSETLAPSGVTVKAPEVRRLTGSGRCDGAPLKATDAPRWCQAERAVVEPVAGADAVRNGDGAVALYLTVAWAHAQAVGDQLGWHDAVESKKLTGNDVGEGEFCLLAAWFRYTAGQGVLETDDNQIINATLDGPIFADIPPDVRQRAFDKGLIGPELCLGT